MFIPTCNRAALGSCALLFSILSCQSARAADAAPDFDPDLGLYFIAQTSLDGSGHENLFADASHNVPAGAFI